MNEIETILNNHTDNADSAGNLYAETVNCNKHIFFWYSIMNLQSLHYYEEARKRYGHDKGK